MFSEHVIHNETINEVTKKLYVNIIIDYIYKRLKKIKYDDIELTYDKYNT